MLLLTFPNLFNFDKILHLHACLLLSGTHFEFGAVVLMRGDLPLNKNLVIEHGTCELLIKLMSSIQNFCFFFF